MSNAATNEPTEVSDLDLFAPDIVADPFPTLDRLRELSPAVHLSRYDFWVLTRYDDVRAAARDWQTFSSAEGVALTPEFNERLAGSILSADPPEHEQLRAVLREKLAPRGLSAVREQIRSYADRLVDGLVERRTFDGVADLAAVYPINVVADLVGLPLEGREKLHPGADAIFAAFGPFGSYAQEHLDALISYQVWMEAMTDRAKIAPGGWGETILDAVDDGRLNRLSAVKAMSAYMTAGMDTTVNAVSAMLRLFAERPDVWAELKDEPTLAGPIFEEILRLESPVQGFWRVTRRDAEVDGVAIPAGRRVMLHWAAANRDPRHYPRPTEFELRRNPVDHLAFGYGIHGCAGQGLARLEAAELLASLLERVDRFELAGDVERRGNPIVRSLRSIPLRVVPTGARP
ncbi:cytochrome P450 [Actinocorallia sp. A-T 12471]|uniref:cytochrome P450 n=1 Tax=Actinocorallia sp. A-T 12471 TaxID=3089813 RepID=UPI0029CE6275|nr:cytochrome P450 [Actinocorallia sp. A-T 12471]MDX6741550.1 cytochrome P450 [Actinocorallia sp. A-T 12471]